MFNLNWLLVSLAACQLVSHHRILIGATQFSIGIEHDMSGPTFGLQGPTSSQIRYDDRNGLALKGTIGDILGPPIKMVSGLQNVVAGSNMAGLGNSLRHNGAVLGVDAKLLEAAGGVKLLKGGLLLGGATAKTGLAALKGGPIGKKISSIIEFPVKVIAVKDLAAGAALAGVGKKKALEASNIQEKGANMVNEGNSLKQQGYSQVMQGASEGMHNINNMFQQTSENAASAFKLLPILLDLPIGDQQAQQQQQQIEQTQQQVESKSPSFGNHHSQSGSLTGGSLFGGLGSLLPGTGSTDPLGLMAGGQHRSPLMNLFGGAGLNGGHGGLQQNGYAALLNATNPLTSLLMSPGMNPLLMPLSQGLSNGGPLSQSLGGKLGGAQTSTFNLFPGLRITEKSSNHQSASSPQEKGAPVEQQQIQQQYVQAPAKQPQQHQYVQAPVKQQPQQILQQHQLQAIKEPQVQQSDKS